MQCIYGLKLQVNDLQQLIDKQEEQINASLNALNKLSVSDYKQEWPYSTKIVFIIMFFNKPITSYEIIKQLFLLDAHFKRNQRPQTSLSSILTRCCKLGRIAKYKVNEKKELLFVLPSWIKKDGDLIDIYKSQINPL